MKNGYPDIYQKMISKLTENEKNELNEMIKIKFLLI